MMIIESKIESASELKNDLVFLKVIRLSSLMLPFKI